MILQSAESAVAALCIVFALFGLVTSIGLPWWQKALHALLWGCLGPIATISLMLAVQLLTS
ncbi:holin [Pseudomonas phage DDSR119]|nr:holin [Pseudomonas phage DDSR119]